MQIGVVGGTGAAGQGLSVRLAAAGHSVLLGSRDPRRAAATVDELRRRWGDRVDGLEGVENGDAADAELVVLATNASALVETAVMHAEQLDGTITLSMGSALRKGGKQFLADPPAVGSLAAEVQRVVPGARVVAALQHVAAAALGDLDRELESDVIVVGDDVEACAAVRGLVEQVAGLRAFDGGPLANAAGVETFAAALLTVNLRHGVEATLQLGGRGLERGERPKPATEEP